MLPVKAPRRDPAPSRLRYRLNRLWLRPGFRRLVNFGLPMLAGVAAAWTVSAEYDLRGRALALIDRAREAIVDRPQFTITELVVPDVSRDLEEAIRVAAFVRLPVSSLELDVGAVRDRIEALDAVERARVRALASGVLEIRAIERVPREALLNWNLEQRTADVFVVTGDTAARRQVTTGLSTGAAVEITKGLAAGDRVVTRGGFAIREGDRVAVAQAEAK